MSDSPARSPQGEFAYYALEELKKVRAEHKDLNRKYAKLYNEHRKLKEQRMDEEIEKELLDSSVKLVADNAVLTQMLFEARDYMSKENAESWQKRINDFLMKRD